MKIIKYKVGSEIFIDIVPNKDEFEALSDGYVIAENTFFGDESVNIGIKYNKGRIYASGEKQNKEGLY